MTLIPRAKLTMSLKPIHASDQLKDVRYEIRRPLAQRAHKLELAGAESIKLNIGNPGAFGFRMPETMRRAMVENRALAEPYCHQNGILPEDVFSDNGVS
jgi:alanine-synthesizing transaminase